LPATVVVALIVAQFAAAGFSLWSASVAARAGARAVQLGRDPAPAARRALPGPLRRDAQVRGRGQEVVARVAVPRLVPLLPVVRVEAGSGLGGG
jgi:hypothetical protein